jgi:hypothetical protein
MPVDRMHMRRAARGCHLQVMQWVREHGALWEADLFVHLPLTAGTRRSWRGSWPNTVLPDGAL